MKTNPNDPAKLTYTTEDRPIELKQWEKDLNFQAGVYFLIIGIFIVILAISLIYSSN